MMISFENTYICRAEKNALQQQYDTTISEVNQRVSQKAGLQINLNETRDTVRETNQHVNSSFAFRIIIFHFSVFEKTFDLEEDIMALKERLMQERNEARQEKVRLEEEIVSFNIYLSFQFLNTYKP